MGIAALTSNTAARITAFVLMLAAVFAITYAIGSALGPQVDTSNQHSTTDHQQSAEQHGGH